ncbi:hypothetical protein MMC25_006014 [Agyrium rufum]|nr:hypothetical protein [Agyrium rufum]
MMYSSSQSILDSLRGQSVTMCDLNRLYSTWPKETHPEVDRLRADVDRWLDETMAGSPSFKVLKKSDFGLFGATWWPRAPFDRLRIVTYLAVWLFTWDDEIDSSLGSLWDEMDHAQAYRAETLRYVAQCLDLPVSDCQSHFEPSSPIISNFLVIGTAIRELYDMEQRQRFYQEVECFMEMSEREQRLRLNSTLPSIEEFWKYRLGSSAVGICLALQEISLGDMHLPSSTLDGAEMRLLWDQTNIIISTVNDMLSLKKEIANGSVESLIPLLYASSGDVQVAMNQTTLFLIASIREFDETAKLLYRSNYVSRAVDEKLLTKFIDGCRFYCTGNLTWSLSTGRYRIHQEDLSMGLNIQL